MSEWKNEFRKTAKELLQRKYDEEHDNIPLLKEPEKPDPEVGIILLALPVGIFLFLNGFVFLFSGFRKFIRFFPDNLIMILIILAAVAFLIWRQGKYRNLMKQYEDAKKGFPELKKKLDTLAADHPEVPRWWSGLQIAEPNSDDGSGSGTFSYGPYLIGTKDGYDAINKEPLEVKASHINCLLEKTDDFYIITQNDNARITDNGKYLLYSAGTVNSTQLYTQHVIPPYMDFNQYVAPEIQYASLISDAERRMKTQLKLTDALSKKEPGQTGLSPEAARLEEKLKSQKTEELLAIKNSYDKGTLPRIKESVALRNSSTFCCLGYAVCPKERPREPIAFALFRNREDADKTMFRLLSVRIPSEDPQGKDQHIGNVVGASVSSTMDEIEWRRELNAFIRSSCGWIDTDFSEKIRWGMDLTQWQNFILSHTDKQ
ncbi:MAG: stage II sporulation protein M [Solobacterium sp.]|nr:stage II sporulation protein M [Solobacterium sp.]